MEQNINPTLKAFLEKYDQNLLKSIEYQKIKAKILDSTDPQDLNQASNLLKKGNLVAFPTETVYGLGANALNPDAVFKIFQTKRRPLTDPVIVHILQKEDGLQYIKEDQNIINLYNYLGDTFWPGPLTLILKADFDKISPLITAQTDFVGIRCPQNETARALLKSFQGPIAAPSANLFSHVSPTQDFHVFNDFWDQDVNILTGQKCDFGIESTVLKLEFSKEEQTYNLSVLRYGSLSESEIQKAIEKNEMFKGKVKFLHNVKKIVINENMKGEEAPGQLLKHYSPFINAYLFECEEKEINQQEKHLENVQLNESIIFDFLNQNQFLKSLCLQYVDLSESGNLKEIMNKLYEMLRWAENVQGAKNVLIFNVESYFGNGAQVEFLKTVQDKIFRSTSGKKIVYNKNLNKFYNVD